MGLCAQPHRSYSVSRRLCDRKPWLPLLQLSHKDHGTIAFIGDFGVVNLRHCADFLVSYFGLYRTSLIYCHSLSHLRSFHNVILAHSNGF